MLDKLRKYIAPILRFENGFIICFGVLFLFLSIYTIPNYGFTWDATEFVLGDKNFYFLKELNTRYLNFTEDNIDIYKRDDHPDFHRHCKFFMERGSISWPIGTTASSFTKFIFFTKLGIMDPIDAHFLSVPLFVAALLGVLYYFVLKNFGIWQAVIAVVTLVSYPRFWAHLHNNTKDVPSCFMFSLVIILFYYATVRDNYRWYLATAFAWGTALATKANAYFLPFVLIPYFAYVLYSRHRNRERLMSRSALIALLLFPVIGIATMFLLWPYLVTDFPRHLFIHLQYLATRGLEGENSWNLIPVAYAITTMPIPVLVLTILGFTRICLTTIRSKCMDPLHLLLMLWIVVPLLRVSIPRARDFDGIRHWLEIFPAVSVLAGIGGAYLMTELAMAIRSRLPGFHLLLARTLNVYVVRLSVVALYFFPITAWNFNNHPYEITFFNRLIGGLGGAQERNLPEATDYWGSSYRTGMRWLNENAEPGAMLMVGVGEHIVHTVEEIWLRDDIVNIRLLKDPYTNDVRPEVTDAVAAHPREVFLMYVTRTDHYTPYVKILDAKSTPVFEIAVDGGVILKILKIK